MAKKKTPKKAKAKNSNLRSRPKKKGVSRAKSRKAPVAKSLVRKSAAKKPAKKVAKPAAKKGAKPVAKKVAKPAAKLVAKPAAKAGAKKVARPVAKKVAPQPKTAATQASAPVVASLRRRDGTGHLDPQYAADLLRRSGRSEPDGVGFFGQSRSSDDLAESLGEQFVEGATTGEGAAEEALDEEVAEERGGPFVRSNAGTEFAEGTDASNPKGSKREPFPTT